MTEKATAAGTHRYADSFRGRAADGHFRAVQGLVLSSLGIGTYLGQPDERTDAAYTEAIVAAVQSGINVIDAAINYRFQRSERSIGAQRSARRKGLHPRSVGPLHQGRLLDTRRENAVRSQQIFFRGIHPARHFSSQRHRRWQPLHGTSLFAGPAGPQPFKHRCRLHRCLLSPQSRNATQRSSERAISGPCPWSRPLSRIGRRRRKNPILRNGYLERLPAGSQSSWTPCGWRTS